MTAVPSPILPAAGSSRKTAAFVVVCVVLVLAAVTLNVLVPKLKITFRKQAVEPAEPLKSIKADVGPWAQISVDRAMPPDFEHELGATYYLFRDYVDTRKLKSEDAKKLLAASMEDREKMRSAISIEPGAVLKFALTYYTGAVDTVPHVPDRCYAADGFAPKEYQVVSWPILPRKNEANRKTGVRLIEFENQLSSRDIRPRQVSYFFQVNGFYEQDPIFGVRKRLQNLLAREAYFGKIELVTDLPDTTAASGAMIDFLQNAMPEVERVLPQKVEKD